MEKEKAIKIYRETFNICVMCGKKEAIYGIKIDVYPVCENCIGEYVKLTEMTLKTLSTNEQRQTAQNF